MGEYDTVPQDADDKQDAIEVPGVADRTDGEEDAPEQRPSDREDRISSSEDDSPPVFDDCLDVGCTWPCAHHAHTSNELDFAWYPELEHIAHQHPKIPRAQLEMKVAVKDCQFCGIFFSIWRSDDCHCGANSHNGHILGGDSCRRKSASCFLRSNGQLSHVEMSWTCGKTTYELGLPPSLARDAPVFPYIPPCTGTLHGDPGSDESLALMNGWIDDCQRCHQLCRVNPQQVGGPKRLLQCLSDGSVRLVDTQSIPQRCDYIALSYCWGDGTAVKKTTEKTLDRHQSGIPNDDLPRLFREVAALARGLNINYLWIDALCIVQDSKEDNDKKDQIMHMGNIFRRALVVVVAASAESPIDSLLRVKPQSGQSHTWRTASLIRYEEVDLDVKFRKRDPGAHLFTDATKSTPVGQRAWCFQDRAMASRCLIFRDDEVVWECRSCCLCECGSTTRRPYRRPYRKMLPTFAEFAPFQLDGILPYYADAEAAYSFWETAVNNYSGRALTFETDRLPAISAVASIVAKSTGDRYLAGLWRDDLLAGLSLESTPVVLGFGTLPKIHNSAHLELGLTTSGGIVLFTFVQDPRLAGCRS